MHRLTKIVGLIFLISLLILIRMFEDSIFYDPMISFFKTDHISSSLPQFNSWKLLGNIALRFIMNTVISLVILWVIFKDFGIIKFSILLYSVFFLFLFIAYSYLLLYSDTKDYLPLFYIRRFLIQPIFLLILLPAFYFQKKKQ